jgi:histidinol-phosphatase (PHP family)
MCGQAVRAGIGAICFTEHVDFDPENPHYGFYDYAAVLREAEVTRNKVGKQVEVRVGVELDLQPPFFRDAAEFLVGKKLDFVLGSFHFMNQEFIGTAAYFRTFRQKSDSCGMGEEKPYSGNYREAVVGIEPAMIEKGIQVYFETLMKLAREAEFDVLAHFDLIKWQGAASWSDQCLAVHEEEARNILRVVAERGKGIEVNTKGLRYGCNEMFPALGLLKAFREAGGEIVTVGSDAHRAEEVGMGIEHACELVHEAGFRRVAFFRARKPHMIRL